MSLIPIGTKVYIRKGATDSNGTEYSSRTNVLTSIKEYSKNSMYPYILEVSTQSWSKYSLILVDNPSTNSLKDLQPFESTKVEGFGQVLRLPNGYVFSNQVTFIPSISNSLQD